MIDEKGQPAPAAEPRRSGSHAAGCDNSGMTGAGGERPPAPGSFNRWLAGGVPMFVAGIVITKFSDNLWFVLPALGGAALYGVWQAPTTKHGPLIQRWLTPILVLAYIAFLVVITLVPDLP